MVLPNMLARLRGLADLSKKRRSWGREAYLHTSRPQNGGKKSPIKIGAESFRCRSRDLVLVGVQRYARGPKRG